MMLTEAQRIAVIAALRAALADKRAKPSRPDPDGLGLLYGSRAQPLATRAELRASGCFAPGCRASGASIRHRPAPPEWTLSWQAPCRVSAISAQGPVWRDCRAKGSRIAPIPVAGDDAARRSLFPSCPPGAGLCRVVMPVSWRWPLPSACNPGLATLSSSPAKVTTGKAGCTLAPCPHRRSGRTGCWLATPPVRGRARIIGPRFAAATTQPGPRQDAPADPRSPW